MIFLCLFSPFIVLRLIAYCFILPLFACMNFDHVTPPSFRLLFGFVPQIIRLQVNHLHSSPKLISSIFTSFVVLITSIAFYQFRLLFTLILFLLVAHSLHISPILAASPAPAISMHCTTRRLNG